MPISRLGRAPAVVLLVVSLSVVATTQTDHRVSQSPVKDQGQRGTCTAFAVAAALETFPGVPGDVSEQFVYAIVKKAQADAAGQMAEWRLPAELAEGSTLVQHVPWFQIFGVPHEQVLPYQKAALRPQPGSPLERFLQLARVTPADLEAVRDTYGKYRLGDDARALSRKEARDAALLRRWLDSGVRAIPISYDIHLPTWRQVTADQPVIAPTGAWHFQSPVGGQWLDREAAQRLLGDRPLAAAVAEDDWNVGFPSDQQADHGGHAVTICGHTAEGFLIKNSWGEGWGDRGYAIVAYETHALLAKEGIHLPSVRLRHQNLNPFERTRQIRAADFRCKVQRLTDGSWTLSTWTEGGPDPEIEIVTYEVESQTADGTWRAVTSRSGHMRSLRDEAARGSGFAVSLDAATVATLLGDRDGRLTLKPAPTVRIAASYGVLDGAWDRLDQANMLRRVTFAAFDPRLRAIVEPAPASR